MTQLYYQLKYVISDKKGIYDKERLLFFNPEIVFDGTLGGIKLIMTVDAFNGHINWVVQEGDHYTDFKDFDEARDYYLQLAFG